MKPARFEYRAPARLEEALEILGQVGDEGKVLAGGQSLVPSMNFRLARPAVLVDVNVDEHLARSVRNIPGVHLVQASRVSARDVANADRVVATKSALEKLQEVLG